ncbi:MAG: hypothetical protein ABI480_11665 [Chitinophagaceae bacterium]
MNKKNKARKYTGKIIGTTPFGGIIIDEPNKYDNDPFFLKKAAEAKAHLEKVGLPKELMNRNK